MDSSSYAQLIQKAVIAEANIKPPIIEIVCVGHLNNGIKNNGASAYNWVSIAKYHDWAIH